MELKEFLYQFYCEEVLFFVGLGLPYKMQIRKRQIEFNKFHVSEAEAVAQERVDG